MTLLIAVAKTCSRMFELRNRPVATLSFEFPPNFPFDKQKMDSLDEEDYPYLRKPTDVDWSTPPQLPEDYNPDEDPDIIAWREAQKPPVILNAQFTANTSELVFPRFHFYYMEHCKYSEAALTAFKQFAEEQFNSSIPLFFTDCNRHSQFCNSAEVQVKRAPIMTYYTANGFRIFAEVEALNDSEQFANFVQLTDSPQLNINPSDMEFCERWKGALRCLVDSSVKAFGEEGAFDIYVNRSVFLVQNISSYNFETCLENKIFVFGNKQTAEDLLEYQKSYALQKADDSNSLICLLDFNTYGPFAYMRWGIEPAVLPVVIIGSTAILPSSPSDVFE